MRSYAERSKAKPGQDRTGQDRAAGPALPPRRRRCVEAPWRRLCGPWRCEDAGERREETQQHKAAAAEPLKDTASVEKIRLRCVLVTRMAAFEKLEKSEVSSGAGGQGRSRFRFRFEAGRKRRRLRGHARMAAKRQRRHRGRRAEGSREGGGRQTWVETKLARIFISSHLVPLCRRYHRRC